MGKLVLVCDDDRPILEVTRTILEGNDLKVVIAMDCEDIVEKALKYKPDLILMDVWIPDTGGDKATRLLKQDIRTCHIPVILFSAVNNLETIALRCGAEGFIPKPFELEEMIDTIKLHLGLTEELSAH